MEGRRIGALLLLPFYGLNVNSAVCMYVDTQLSNEIIRRCCKEINLDRIFSGYVQSSVKTLQECISCCDQWKDIYRQVRVEYVDCEFNN